MIKQVNKLRTFKDQTGTECIVPDKSEFRVVSIVPSQTEILYYLGIKPIAQTVFCIHPKIKFKTSVKVGGTKKLNINKILNLKPDLVIGNKEENSKSDIEELRKHVPVWMSDIYNLQDATDMISQVGIILDKPEQSSALVNDINILYNAMNSEHLKSCLYLIWNEPMMAVGRNTFINSMLQYAGFENAILEIDSRYPELTEESVKRLNPEFILLSSEPFPFKEVHKLHYQKLFPNSKVMLVNGEMFSWYGNRLIEAAGYFERLTEN